MPRYQVKVIETVTYDAEPIEAACLEDAEEKAQELHDEGILRRGDYAEMFNNVEFEVVPDHA